MSVSIIAYLYLSLTYAGYPYIIKAMVPKKYRGIDIEFDMPQVSQKAKFIFIVVVCLLLCLLLPVAAPLMLSFFLGMAVKEAKIMPYQELLEGGITSFSSLFLGLVLGCLCEASTIHRGHHPRPRHPGPGLFGRGRHRRRLGHVLRGQEDR